MRITIQHISCLIFLLLVGTQITTAQNERQLARLGNERMEAGDYEKAVEYYNRALEINPDMPKVRYNIALAKYKSEAYEEAAEKFNELSVSSDDKQLKSKAYHNLGNSFLKQEKWQEGAEAFKKALMNDPTDEDARYNLSYALRKIQEEEDQDDNEDEDDDQDDDQDDEDENEDEGDDDEDGEDDEDGDEENEEDQDEEGDDENEDEQDQDDGDDEEDEDGSDQDEGDDEQEQDGEQPDQLSQEDVERLLDAMMNEERQVQESLEQQKGQSVQGRQIEKEW